MAHYLPVLLVSVNTNATPDDLSVSTLPRGQVDYLSHEWEEEDVWRSWRNMTRQKNEIANGMRLENASWRTWWKQRNKLKTVTPETLNWLKDSDVTWLYGPLHTAVDWAPPPKPKPDPKEVGKDHSAHDRLDLVTHTHSPVRSTLSRNKPAIPQAEVRISAASSYATSSHYYTTPTHYLDGGRTATPVTFHKPILKHRSISELLTSDLPSPIWSDDEDDDGDHHMAEIEEENSASEKEDDYSSSSSGKRGGNASSDSNDHKRPKLMHIKSDSHVEKWGPNRAFRKDSPPRIIAPEPGGDEVHTTEVMMREGFLGVGESSSSGSNANSTSTSSVSSPGSSSDHLGPQVESPLILSRNHSPILRSGHGTLDECSSHPNAPPHTHSHAGSYFPSRAHPSHHLSAQQAQQPHGFADGSFPHTAHHTPTRKFSVDSRPSSSRTTSRANSREGGRRKDGTGRREAPKKKHITFNTFVEQCIAVDQPKSVPSRTSSSTGLARSNSFGNGSRNGSFSAGFPGMGMGPGIGMGDIVNSAPRLASTKSGARGLYDDGYDDDEGDNYAGEHSWVGHGSTAWPKQQPHDVSDSDSDANEEDDDDVLEMRSHRVSRRPVAHTSHSASSIASASSAAGRFRPPLMRAQSSDKEHITIAPIAPTTLKTVGVGNGWVDGFGDEGGFSDDGITPSWYTGPHGRSGHPSSRARGRETSNIPVELVYVPPVGSNYLMPEEPQEIKDDDEGGEVVWHHQAYFSVGQPTAVPAVGVVRSPVNQVPPRVTIHPESFGDGAEEDAYDYFGGPDLGEDFAQRKTVSGSRRSREDVREDDEQDSSIKYGSPKVVVAASRGSATTTTTKRTSPIEVPRVVSSPAVAVPSRVNTDSSSMLSPPLRGRTSSVSSFDGERGESRGRSISRVPSSSSLSGRSGSRGTNSPLGSISPEGSKVNLPAGASGNQRRGRSSNGGVSRKMSSSLSPDHMSSSPSSSSTSPIVRRASSSSSLGSSTTTVTGKSSSTSTFIPDAIPEAEEDNEEEVQRSLHPTPANSPVLAKMEAMVAPAAAAAAPSPQPLVALPTLPIPIVARSFNSTTPPKSSTSSPPPPPPSSPPPPTRGSIFRHSRNESKDRSTDEGNGNGNVVGRAVNIAGAFLGSMWR